MINILLMYFLPLLPPWVGLSFWKQMARCSSLLFHGILNTWLKRTLQHLYQTMPRKLLNHLFLFNNFFLPMFQKFILLSQLVMAVVSVAPLSSGMLTPIRSFCTHYLLTNGTMMKSFASFKQRMRSWTSSVCFRLRIRNVQGSLLRPRYNDYGQGTSATRSSWIYQIHGEGTTISHWFQTLESNPASSTTP